MNPLIKRLLAYAGIFTYLLFNAQLFAADRATVQVFAPKELTEALLAISATPIKERIILHPEGELQRWHSMTASGPFVVISARSKAFLDLINGDEEKALVEKGETLYAVRIEWSGISIPPDTAPSNDVYAYLFGSKAQSIFRAHGYAATQVQIRSFRDDPLVTVAISGTPNMKTLNEVFQGKVQFGIEGSVLYDVKIRRSNKNLARTLIMQYRAAHPEIRKFLRLSK